MKLRIGLPLILVWACAAQPLATRGSGGAPSLREAKVNGRDAYILENGLIRIALLRGGGHIAEVRLISDDARVNVNPMRVPHYPTIDPHTYDESKHNAIYGKDPHRWMHSGYMGHLLCFPIYGPPSADEARRGLGNHGEAGIVEWRKLAAEETDGAVVLRYGADLPKTQFRVERAVTLRKGDRFASVEEWVESLVPFDRPINWMQHATFGPPFAEPGKTFLDLSATRGLTAGGRTASLAPNAEVAWPEGKTPEGGRADLRVFQPKPHSGTYCALLLDPARKSQFFTMYHQDYRALIGYVFPSEGNPWIADWQENRSSKSLPWNGEAVARGIEFGSSPFAEGLRRSVERGSLFGAPAYRWIGGGQRLKTEFIVFATEIPEGFRGVRDVQLIDGAPEITPK